MSRPKLLHVFSTFDAGGPQVRTAQLFAAAKDEFEHVVVAMDGRYGCRERIPEDLGVRYLSAPRGRGPLQAFAMFGLLLKQQAQLVLTYNWGAIDSVLACQLEGSVPLLHHEDGFGPDEVQVRKRRRSLARIALLDRADRVIVPSQLLRKIATQEWSVQPARLLCIPNGIDTERFAPGSREDARKSLGLDKDAFIIGAVGHLRGEKDHANLVRAFAKLEGEPQLVLVGEGSEKERILSLAGELGIAQRLHLPGFMADPRRAYQSFDLYVLPSKSEQMPVGLLEAMACGCPVVACDVGDVRMMLPDSLEQLVVPSQNPEALAAAMQSLLSNAEARSSLSQVLRAHVIDRYREEEMCRRHIREWQRLTGRL
ncbi:MAG: hypothetical protein CSA62_09265 [Planctomycetota bacterium]|nr:MAG: hypothetical protein CSA62_09265 [Planctomycetota bacterium]